jgi:hypothetical protein
MLRECTKENGSVRSYLPQKRKPAPRGCVYAASSQALPGIIKIGSSKKVKQRIVERNKMLTGLGIPPLGLLFFIEVDDYKAVETAIHIHLRDYCTTKDAHPRDDVGSRELFEVGEAKVRQVFGYAGIVIDGDECAFLNRVPDPAPGGRGRYAGGGYALYVWLRDHCDEIKERMTKPDFSWGQLSYEASVAIAQPGKPFVGYAPIVVQNTWRRARYMEETYGPNPFKVAVRPTGNVGPLRFEPGAGWERETTE